MSLLTSHFFTVSVKKYRRFHVALGLFSSAIDHRSVLQQITSVTHLPDGSCATFLVSPYCDMSPVIYY